MIPAISDITTARLNLRPLRLEDAQAVSTLAGNWNVARHTLRVPHPYTRKMAQEWIRQTWQSRESGKGLVLAMEHRAQAVLLGVIGLEMTRPGQADLGYWVGEPWWGQGYATEAVEAMLAIGFDRLGLQEIGAEHLAANPASGRVMQKAGMHHEASLIRPDRDGRQVPVERYRFRALEKG